MTDDTMKDLVTKHDATITQLVTSVEHLVSSQTETNKRLEDVTTLLSQQLILRQKVEVMEKEIDESFKRRDREKRDSDKRLHARIDEVEEKQKSEKGCQSVMLLTKDVEENTREITRLTGNNEEYRIKIENQDKKIEAYPSSKVIISVSTVVFGYMIIFGTYVVQSLNKFDTTVARMTVMLQNDFDDIKEVKGIIKGK